jgi:hypothetical protein
VAEALGERWNGCSGGGFVTCVFVSRLTWSEMNFRDDPPGATPNQRSMNQSSKRSDEAKWNISIWRLVRCWQMLAQPFWSWRPQTFQWDIWKIYENLGIFTGLEESVSICCFWYLVKDSARYSIRPDRVVSSNSIILLPDIWISLLFIGYTHTLLLLWGYDGFVWKYGTPESHGSSSCFHVVCPCEMAAWLGYINLRTHPYIITIYILYSIHIIILYYIILYCIILYYIVLYHTILFYIILYYIVVE